MLFAHHIEINLFGLVIEPETMPEHAVLAAASAVLVGFLVYCVRCALRDLRSWIGSRRNPAGA